VYYFVSVKEDKNMKLIIDTDKKMVEVPSEFKVAYENLSKANKMLGKENQTLSSMLDLSEYKVVAKPTRAIKDTTNAKTIETFMNGVKDTDKDNYKEYVDLKNKVVKTTEKGTQIKTNFLTIKKWFYEKYPEQNPFKK
jgi:hypothetical protein